jgi:hypothetical protein
VANAGDDRQAEIGSVVKMDASGSTDPEGDVLIYKWSFLSVPKGSAAVIIGVGNEQAEFIMDRAGGYVVQLLVSDGAIQSTDSLTIKNTAPLIQQIYPQTFTDLEQDDIAEQGKEIRLFGDHFSPIREENKATLAGMECEVTAVLINNNPGQDRLFIKVPKDANPGELVITVGAQSTAWPKPIRLLENPPVETFIANGPTLVKTERIKPEYRDIGFTFRPLVNGEVVKLGAISPHANGPLT